MNQEDFCSYELALKLKACGFDEPCDHYYTPNKTLHIVKSNALAPEITNNRFLDEIDDGCCTAVPLWHAQKWLREVKNIIVDVSPDWDSEDYCMVGYLTGEWYFSVWKDGDRVYCNFDPNAEEERIWMFEKYEQALSSGIYAALELIKKGE